MPERVTTGSEPKRKIYVVLDSNDWPEAATFDKYEATKMQRKRGRSLTWVEVVESGHDEQTEALIRDLAHYSGPVTVAVMAAFCARAQAIEERFKPSAPGGGNA